jgi:spore germination cell wall hydrolase CwlJ-like protein
MAAMVMLSGFAVSSIETDEEASTSDVDLVNEASTTVAVLNLTAAQERARLLADSDALYRATMWLARCIYSESYLEHEQELVAWVVRNRVETRYRGKSKYRSVITDPYQFSAFNDQSITRELLVSMDSTFTGDGWLQAVAVARKVILADPSSRPFPVTVRHFYSEQSLGGAEVPEWATQTEPVEIDDFKIDEKRFRFYNGVS